MSGSKNWYIYTMEYYATHRKKKEFLPFATALVGTGDYYAKSGVSNSLSLGGHISLAVAFKGPNVISTP